MNLNEEQHRKTNTTGSAYTRSPKEANSEMQSRPVLPEAGERGGVGVGYHPPVSAPAAAEVLGY